jgi:hypothetical protein
MCMNRFMISTLENSILLWDFYFYCGEVSKDENL